MTTHGTEAHYVHARCRCAACHKAAVDARRDRRERHREATRAYDRAYKRRRREARRAEHEAAAVSEPCNCLTYGHGLTMTRVPRRNCPVHGEGYAAGDVFAQELADTRDTERAKWRRDHPERYR